ncbi:MAG: MFS transporter [Lachnospiraceae bacterium]|nr:MFS transporter [Lachnospiraceae bacterium]
MKRVRKENYTHTIYACYVGYIVQAIINNLPPLLFLTFEQSMGISISRIGLLITINFGTQIVVDFLAAKYVDRIGYRRAIVAAHMFCIFGLLFMGILPRWMGNAYAGLVIAMVCNAIGGGLIEVLISPIVEAAPSSDAKETAMSLLHSFYCWGHVLVVLLSTVGFWIVGMEHWYYLPMIWSIVPLINLFSFLRVPIRTLVEEDERTPAKELLSTGAFWLFFLLMLCAGASEQGMSQWVSLFAEDGLGVSKTVGDILGPCLFAALMGTSRMLYGKFGEHICLRGFMMGSSALCVLSYLMAVFLKNPFPALLGCGLCGLSVGILWPGTFSLAAKGCPCGGTLLFGLLALAGDLGCTAGPTLVSTVSSAFPQYGLKTGLFAAIIFPCLMFVLLHTFGKRLHE